MRPSRAVNTKYVFMLCECYYEHQTKRTTVGDRSFHSAEAKLWNKLPNEIWNCEILN